MLLVGMFSYPPANRLAVQARFKETRGLPPAGVKLMGRWHAIGAGKGVFVCECDDPMAMAKLVQDWSDLLSFDIYPALDDEGAAKRLAM